MTKRKAQNFLVLMLAASVAAISFLTPVEALAPVDVSSSSHNGTSAGSISTGGSAAPKTSASRGQAPNTSRKPLRLRYGKLLRTKPADPGNFGLLKSYCSHSHGRRWCAKPAG